MALGIRRTDHGTPLYSQTLALTSPTSGSRSVGIVGWRAKAEELLLSSGTQRHVACLKSTAALHADCFMLIFV
jgi:hypothetical protein